MSGKKEPVIEALVVESKCSRTKVGDKLIFNGPILDKENSDIVCCTALVAIYPLVGALRFGADPKNWGNEDKIVTQCPDQASAVTYELRRIG